MNNIGYNKELHSKYATMKAPQMLRKSNICFYGHHMGQQYKL